MGGNFVNKQKSPRKLCRQTNSSGHPVLAKLGPGELILLAFVWDKTASGTARSTKRVDGDLLLAVVWDETASGTARSKTQVLLKVNVLNS